MAKDPAFLFYPGDYLGGTMGFTFEQHGLYIITLLYQFNNGHFSEENINNVLQGKFDLIRHKFVQDKKKFFYNEKLENEQEKRKKYSDSRRNNRKNKGLCRKDMKNISNTYDEHMENENENKNITLFNYKNAVDRIYKLYPSQCIVSGRRLRKSEKDKDKIEKILKAKNYPLYRSIQVSIVDCKKHKIYLQNFSTFLNNLPDSEEIRNANFKLISFDVFIETCKSLIRSAKKDGVH